MSFIEYREHANGVVEFALARAPVNALNPGLCAQLADGVRGAIAGGASGIVLSGGPKVFSAGLDVPHLLGLGADRAALRTALLGWMPADADGPIEFAGGTLIKFENGQLWWNDRWRVPTLIRSS